MYFIFKVEQKIRTPLCSFSLKLYALFLQDPSSLAKVQEEVDRVLQGRHPTYEDIKDLKYLTRCIIESLRLYPHPPVGCYASFCSYQVVVPLNEILY